MFKIWFATRFGLNRKKGVRVSGPSYLRRPRAHPGTSPGPHKRHSGRLQGLLISFETYRFLGFVKRRLWRAAQERPKEPQEAHGQPQRGQERPRTTRFHKLTKQLFGSTQAVSTSPVAKVLLVHSISKRPMGRPLSEI